jgi:hypothetical protein
MRQRALLLLLVSGCAWPLKGYEVPILPEEVALMTADRITAGILRRDLDQILSAYSDDFHSVAYDAGRWVKAGSSPGLETRRWTTSMATRELDKAGIRVEWEKYLSGFRAIGRVEQKARVMETRQTEPACTLYLVVMGVDLDGRFRSDRFWIRYTLSNETGPWLVTDQKILEGDAALGDRSRFRDIARDNGTAYPHSPTAEFGPKQMAGNSFPLVVRGDSGVAVADFDGDGWVDIYYCDGVRNALLRNRGDGTFEDVTEKAGLGGPQAVSRSAIFADFDNDGRLDLFVTYEAAPCRLYKNLGNGTFRDVTEQAGVGYVGFPTSVAVADYDNDGLLDIYIGCYGDHTNRYPELKSKNGDPNILFRNLGGMRFRDVTSETGTGDRGWTLGVAWGDYNGDGRPDLFVCNDFGTNTLFRNEGGGRFTDVTEEAGVALEGFGMSCAFGDYNNDGTLDLYLAGMFSNAGQWIFKNDDLLPGPYLKDVRKKVLGLLDTMTGGNRLFRNDGNGRFTEVARKAGVEYGQFAWCSPWADFDNDGHLDLYCCNGYWTGPSPEDT